MRVIARLVDLSVNALLLLLVLAAFILAGCRDIGLDKPEVPTPGPLPTVARGESQYGWVPGKNLAYGKYRATFGPDAPAGQCWWRVFAADPVKADYQSTNRGGSEVVEISLRPKHTLFRTIGSCPDFVRIGDAP